MEAKIMRGFNPIHNPQLSPKRRLWEEKFHFYPQSIQYCRRKFKLPPAVISSSGELRIVERSKTLPIIPSSEWVEDCWRELNLNPQPSPLGGRRIMDQS